MARAALASGGFAFQASRQFSAVKNNLPFLCCGLSFHPRVLISGDHLSSHSDTLFPEMLHIGSCSGRDPRTVMGDTGFPGSVSFLWGQLGRSAVPRGRDGCSTVRRGSRSPGSSLVVVTFQAGVLLCGMICFNPHTAQAKLVLCPWQ